LKPKNQPMAKKYKTKRKGGSFISPLISITLVLFLFGLFCLIVIYADQLKNYLKENVQLSIEFDENAKEADVIRLQNMFENESYIHKTDYIDKEESLEIMKEQLGDVQSVLGYNPIPPTLELYFKPSFANVDSLDMLKNNLSEYSFIKEIYYRRADLENIDKNINIGTIIILTIMLIVLIISLVLINNTVRLTMYSKRFLIKSMQLVGATQGFIRKPFVLRALSMGIVGSILATGLLAVFLAYIDSKIPVQKIGDLYTYIILFVILIAIGIFITVISSYYSVKKYLKMKLDELY
jgi:cell division transport system permease protein